MHAPLPFDVFIHNFVGIGVPLFLFMAGYFVKRKPGHNFMRFMHEKLVRIYLPSVIWTIIFNLAFSFLGGISSFNLGKLLAHVLLLSNPTFYYFTFVIIILFALGYVLHSLSDQALTRFVKLAFVVNLLVIVGYELLLWRTSVGAQLSGVAMYRNPLVWVFFFSYGVYTARLNSDFSQKWFLWLASNRHRDAFLSAHHLH